MFEQDRERVIQGLGIERTGVKKDKGARPTEGLTARWGFLEMEFP